VTARQLTAGSLFSGVGGLDLGTEAAGYRTAFQVEWDRHATAVLERHWPDVPRWSDVADVNGADLPPVDLITFGSPCQDLSIAGKRAGLAGTKSGLFAEAIRIIEEMRNATDHEFPRWAIWENVAGALSSNRGRDFAVVVDRLADVGALVVEWSVLDARFFRVPQRRRRVFVVACFDPATARRCPDPLLPLAPSGARHPQTSGEAREDVAHTLAARAGGGGWPDGGDGRTSHLVPTLTTRCGATFDDQQLGQLIPVGTLTERSRQPGPDEAAAGQLIPFHLTQDPIAGDDTHTPAMSAGNLNGCATIGVALAFSENQRSEVVLTVPAYKVRRLTPLECERLMGWPDDHTRYRADGTEQADAQRYKQCGNGVVAPVAEWIAGHLAAVARQVAHLAAPLGVDSRGPR
jgi:DNA (cytosine-5)-methyltransferase 1